MRDKGIPSTHFETAGLTAADQFDAWRERISVIFNVEPLDNPANGFAAETSAFHLGDLLWVRTNFAGQQFLRTPGQIRADWLDHYLVQFYRGGGYVGEAGAEVNIAPGSVSVLDLARPLHTHANASDVLSLVVPRDVMGSLLPDTDHLHGLILQSGSAGLLADHLNSLERRLPELSLEQAPQIATATGNLLAACLAPTADNLQQARGTIEPLLRERVRKYIDANLGSPELSPGSICQALSLSRTQLYELFHATGGVQKYIQKRRLHGIHSALSNPSERRSIMVLAEKFGFSSHAHVSRAFRQNFGYSPSAVRLNPAGIRDALAQRAANDGYSTAVSFDEWIRLLRK